MGGFGDAAAALRAKSSLHFADLALLGALLLGGAVAATAPAPTEADVGAGRLPPPGAVIAAVNGTTAGGGELPCLLMRSPLLLLLLLLLLYCEGGGVVGDAELFENVGDLIHIIIK